MPKTPVSCIFFNLNTILSISTKIHNKQLIWSYSFTSKLQCQNVGSKKQCTFIRKSCHIAKIDTYWTPEAWGCSLKLYNLSKVPQRKKVQKTLTINIIYVFFVVGTIKSFDCDLSCDLYRLVTGPYQRMDIFKRWKKRIWHKKHWIGTRNGRWNEDNLSPPL